MYYNINHCSIWFYSASYKLSPTKQEEIGEPTHVHWEGHISTPEHFIGTQHAALVLMILLFNPSSFPLGGHENRRANTELR